jgi:tetratricopeptide (TPR) repeat protein
LHLQRLDEAQEAFETALRIFETNLGPHHMDVLGTRMNLAGVLAERGDLQGASAEYEQVLEAAEATLGRDHPQIAVILNNFADVEAAQGHHDVAQAMAARAITLVESSYGVEDVELFYPLLVMGRSLVQQEEFATALSYLDRALALRTSDATVVGVLCGRGKLRPLLLTHYRP